MRYKDQLVLTGEIDEVGAPIRENVGDSYRLGLELEANLALSDQWLWQPNITLSENKNLDFRFQRDGALQNLGNTNIAYSPNLVVGSNLVFVPSTQFQVGVLSKYVGEQYLGNIDADLSKLPAYFINDLNVTYSIGPLKWVKNIDFSLLVNNIFNAQFESNGYFYTYDDTWSDPNQVTTIEGGVLPTSREKLPFGDNHSFLTGVKHDYYKLLSLWLRSFLIRNNQGIPRKTVL